MHAGREELPDAALINKTNGALLFQTIVVFLVASPFEIFHAKKSSRKECILPLRLVYLVSLRETFLFKLKHYRFFQAFKLTILVIYS